MLNRDIFALKAELETIRTELQKLDAWLHVSMSRLEIRLEAMEAKAAANKAVSNQGAALTRPILRAKK
jgi:hypothetical protein